MLRRAAANSSALIEFRGEFPQRIIAAITHGIQYGADLVADVGDVRLCTLQQPLFRGGVRFRPRIKTYIHLWHFYSVRGTKAQILFESKEL
jgi:uncharacterized membrane protein YcfT